MKKIRVYLQLTKSCNLQCKMCDFWKNKKEKFKRNHFFDLIDIFIKNDIKGITFWWWEPFLNTEIYDLIRYSKENWLNTEIITNWTIIDKIKLKDSIEYLDEIIFSIDSWIWKIHEQIRWRNLVFDKIISNLSYISELKRKYKNDLVITIDTTILKDNFDSFESVIDLAKKYNTKINFDPVQILWYWNEKDKWWLLLNEEEAFIFEKKLLNFWKENSVYLIQTEDSIKRIIKYFKWYKIDNYCTSLNRDLLVDPYWNILKCWWSGEVLYNIIDNKGIKEEKLKMNQACYGCWFTHVRDDDYFSGYSVTNDIFEGNTY